MNQTEALTAEQMEALRAELAKARKARAQATPSPSGEKVFSVYSR